MIPQTLNSSKQNCNKEQKFTVYCSVHRLLEGLITWQVPCWVLYYHIQACLGLYPTCQKIATHFRHKGIMKYMASKQPFNKSIKAIYLTPKVKNENKPLASKLNYTYRGRFAGDNILSCQGFLIIKKNKHSNYFLPFCLFPN